MGNYRGSTVIPFAVENKFYEHEEYRVLHNVAQILQSPGELMEILQKTMKALTEFEGLQFENKAGNFLADNKDKMLRLLTTYGNFSQEFLEKEKNSAIR